jgi:single-strand DNA-binding protein
MSLNKCMIIGNLGRDPEMRYTPSGQAVTQFTVAVNRNYKDAQGERQEETEWFRVVAWGQQAEFSAEYLRKGAKVYIEGRIQTRQWEGQDGQKRYTTELVANTIQNLERRPREDAGGDGGSQLPPEPRQRPQAGAARPAAAPSEPSPEPDYDDLPF